MNGDVFDSMVKSVDPDRKLGKKAPRARKEEQVVSSEVPRHIDFGTYIAGVGSAVDWLCIEARKQYEEGRTGVLMEVVFVCACIQAVIPDWAVDALMNVRKQLVDGALSDYNEAFGKLPTSRTKRASAKNRLDHTGQVIQILGNLRVREGFNLSREGLEEAAKRIREQGLKVSTDDVRRIYEQHGAAIRNTEIGSDGEFNSGFLVLPLDALRRRGRPVLDDTVRVVS